jgi:hypothetical protein
MYSSIQLKTDRFKKYGIDTDVSTLKFHQTEPNHFAVFKGTFGGLPASIDQSFFVAVAGNLDVLTVVVRLPILYLGTAQMLA